MAQVIVYGPNRARTTANDKPDESGPFKGTSELQRLLAGEIEGREGFAGATQSEPLTEDYPGDYGGEDASTPINERESVVGVGNTGYDTKDYSYAGPGDPLSVTSEPTSSPGQASEQFSQLVDSGQKDFLNIPDNAFLWDVDGTLYLAYEVPGAVEKFTKVIQCIWLMKL